MIDKHSTPLVQPQDWLPAARRRAFQWTFWSALFAIPAAFGVGLELLQPILWRIAPGANIEWVAIGLPVLIVVGALIPLFVTLRFKPTPFARAVNARPEDIVWVHTFRVVARHSSIPQFEAVYVGWGDGASLNAPDQSGQLARRIAEHCPWATSGYSDELREWFRREPSSLRRATPGRPSPAELEIAGYAGDRQDIDLTKTARPASRSLAPTPSSSVNYVDLLTTIAQPETSKRVFVGPAIPEPQLTNLRYIIPERASIVVALDLTLLGSAEYALVFTDQQLWAYDQGKQQSANLADIVSASGTSGGLVPKAEISLRDGRRAQIPCGVHGTLLQRILTAIAERNREAA